MLCLLGDERPVLRSYNRWSTRRSACSIVAASAGIDAVPYEHSMTTPSLASESALPARSAVANGSFVT